MHGIVQKYYLLDHAEKQTELHIQHFNSSISTQNYCILIRAHLKGARGLIFQAKNVPGKR